MSRVLRLFLPVFALVAALIGLSDIRPAEAASGYYVQPYGGGYVYDGYRDPYYSAPRAAPRKLKRQRAVTHRHATHRNIVTRIDPYGRVYTAPRAERPVAQRSKAKMRQEARRKAQARQRIAARRLAIQQEIGRESRRAQARGQVSRAFVPMGGLEPALERPAPRVASLGDTPRQSRLSSSASNVEARIDIASQRMVVSVDGEVRHVWKVSTGRKGFSTPRGAYKPQRMHVSYFSRKYYNSPMPYSIFFRGGYAIHGTTAINRLGGPASHGCVRLATGNARTLFNLVRSAGPARTRIIIS
ncbi:MAG: L,D-transpeptidase family protein [Beijerinckiaceae bacterium]|jgi:lipoprotein-anchoring transpeptidase ErfK/SrfK|nr:L,D-transpeptidase family protein [Beijerinckiaceae bacterium]